MEPDAPHRYTVPFKYSDYPKSEEMAITEENIVLICWNQADYHIHDSQKTLKEIVNIDILRECVFDAAQNDELCIDIKEQFLSLYGIDLFAAAADKEDHFYKLLIKPVFFSWPHPMIGNILTSPRIRPQYQSGEYVNRWSSFPEDYFEEATAASIAGILKEPSSVNLEKLEKSGRDQVRICRDMTELARAIMGEISTYATKKLEKIFALDLCCSDKLLDAQRQLITDIVHHQFKEFVLRGGEELHDVYLQQIFMHFYNPFFVFDYLKFYFPIVTSLKNNNMQWTVFVYFINKALGKDSGLKCDEPDDETKKIITECDSLLVTLPSVILCSMIINDIRKFEKKYVYDHYSVSVPQGYSFKGSPFFPENCTFMPSESHFFIPELSADSHNLLTWSWNRDENYLTTQTYRHFLLPLWAGPSSHAAGIMDFYIAHLGSDYRVKVDDIPVLIQLIVAPSMFAFWRLYYDKRISGVHTLTETFEAGFTFSAEEQEDLKTYVKAALHTSIQLQIVKAAKHEFPDFMGKDPFYIVLNFLSYSKDGYMNPVLLMEILRTMYYPASGSADEKLTALDNTIKQIKEKLVDKGFQVPLWSKPLENTSSAAAMDKYNKTFRGLVIRNYVNLNVQIFIKKLIYAYFLKSAALYAFLSSDRLVKLYNKISSLMGKSYCFSEDFDSLPVCLVDYEERPFLAALTFTNIKDCTLEDGTLKFTGNITTDAEFWNCVREITSIDDKEEISCTVTDDGTNFLFCGEIGVNSVFKITENLSLNIRSIVQKSGLDEFSSSPQIIVMSEITAGNDSIALSISVPISGTLLYIDGSYEDGKTFTLQKLLSIFGLDGVISASSLLPDDESVFGSLGLKEVSITIEKNTLKIEEIDFTITAARPWSILDNKITFQPYFKMEIVCPFDSENRNTDYSLLGVWTIGPTSFDIMYRCGGTIYAGLSEKSELNFADVAELFAEGVEFPDIKITGMEFDADIKSGNYSLYLSADDILKFDVGTTQIGIDSVSFSLNYSDGKFGQLVITGQISLAGFTMQMSGSYGAAAGLDFQAVAYSDGSCSLINFASQIAEELGTSFSADSIPDSFAGINIRTFMLEYKSVDSSFLTYIDLDNVLVISEQFAIKKFSLKISCAKDSAVEFEIIAELNICQNTIILSLSKENGEFIISGSAQLENLTFKSAAEEFGINTDALPEFIKNFTVNSVSIKYNFTKKTFSAALSTSAGEISAAITAGVGSEWRISYKTAPSFSINMSNMPLAGELVEKVSSDTTDFSVKDFEISISSKEGAEFSCLAFGSVCEIELYKPKENSSAFIISKFTAAPATVKWIELNKNYSMLTISKVGIGLDNSYAALLLCASLNVSPFSFSLTDAGVGVDIANPADFAFYLSGFGISFDNGIFSIGGSFSRNTDGKKTVYQGSLSIKFKDISATAIGEYSSGSLMAYLAVTAPIGGPPAFFVTGLAAGFGYNKRLNLPEVEDVPKFPLITAAVKGFDSNTLEELKQCMEDEGRQNFLTAGVKFNSFQMIDGFLLLSVSFGNNLEIGVLGLADISIPPKVKTNPIAKAQLAIKAHYNQAHGVFSAEACLTSESYILSSDCKLTGDFAAYFWFKGSSHDGDFVVSLGGYHPSFKKPEHYPSVPRLGLNWQVSSCIKITGEIYFALTPSAVMAGGALSAVYSQGNLKAWFIAHADFLLAWKPFRYDISVGVSVGASYSVDFWFIHKTFSIELAARLHLWGPEVQGEIYISWFIISFTISFSKGKDNSESSLDWAGFKSSFLTGSANHNAHSANHNARSTNEAQDILTISAEGMLGQAADGTDIADPNSLSIELSSKIPESGNVRPVNDAKLASSIELHIKADDGTNVDNRFIRSAVTKNVPAAMWKKSVPNAEKLKEDSVVKDAVCGVLLAADIESSMPELFPEMRFISLTELYKKNLLEFYNCFCFTSDLRMNLSSEDSINKFSQNAESEETVKNRQKFLADYGITQNVSLSRYAADAENLLTENILLYSGTLFNYLTPRQ